MPYVFWIINTKKRSLFPECMYRVSARVTMCHENTVPDFILLRCKKPFPGLSLLGLFVLKLPELSPLLNLAQ